MQTKRQELFTTIRSEGAILPPDLLQRVAAEDATLEGITAGDFHLSGERINEAVNRSWNALQGAWTAFRQQSEKLAPDDVGTSVTRERWLLPLFKELGYGRLQGAKAFELGDNSYPVSHVWQHAPIHLVGFRVDLDKRTAGVAGASRSSPHSLVQELLNREEGFLWAFVSNGLRLRILRDNKSLTRQAFVEFDLQAMMDGQVYPDFKLLWLLCHQSRVEAERPEHCWLEQWSQAAVKQGTRALDTLRDGVQRAIEALGRGFLAHRDNAALRDRLRLGTLDKQDYYRQVLRLIYRLLFLFVAEDRNLLLTPDADARLRERYIRHYSTQRLRDIASRIRGTPHTDLYQALGVLFSHLDQTGCPQLGLPALGSFLWSPAAIADLAGAQLGNHDLLAAVRELAFTVDANSRRPVDYRNLGAEELGSIYESLLELRPDLNAEAASFTLTTVAGHERKTTGSYYTPSSLVNCLLDSTLEPVLDDAVKGGRGYEDRGATAEERIRSLKVCDTACGSGHFLIAAAHRMAKRLATARTGEDEPTPEIYRHALRDVIRHCIYGVDINPMAVELCRVALWMESLEPGRPLSFLEAHVKVGNSLIGATPALLARGIPDEAFDPVTGDDKAVCRELRKRNTKERESIKAGQTYLFDIPFKLGNMPDVLARIGAESEDSVADVQRHREIYEKAIVSAAYENARFLADAWCAAFVWRKNKNDVAPHAITEKTFRDIERSPHNFPPNTVEYQEIRRLAAQYNFFHWHLAFPEAFGQPNADETDGSDNRGWFGGFDIVIGNPPWEKLQTEEEEYFAASHPEIASLTGARRKTAIKTLSETDPLLASRWYDQRSKDASYIHFARDSGRFPLTAQGKFNTFGLFAELHYVLLRLGGRAGCVLPSGICADDTAKIFFQEVVSSQALVSLFDFENREGIFPAVDSRFKFCLLTLTRAGARIGSAAVDLAFFLHNVTDLAEEGRRFVLTDRDFALVNPNTRTCPIFRNTREVALALQTHRTFGVFVREVSPVSNAWSVSMHRMLNMTDDSNLFVNAEEQGEYAPDQLVPLYEAKYIHHFNHRWNGEAEDPRLLSDPHITVSPRYYVRRIDFDPYVPSDWQRNWILGWRDITNVTNERTIIAAVMPRCAAGNTIYLLYPTNPLMSELCCLVGNLASFVLDFFARLKVAGTHLNFTYLRQLPVLPPASYHSVDCVLSPTTDKWIADRVLELTYTAWDLKPFANDCGYSGPPFIWDEERRRFFRYELDAAYFHLYGVNRDDADYILSTFPIVERKDREKYGTYRTKDTILEIYDAMATAIRTGQSYETRLNPPPGPPANADGSFKPLPIWNEGQPRPANWPLHIHPPRHAQPAQPAIRPAAPAVITGKRVADVDLIVQAFADVRDGMSSDYVVACPEVDAKFIARARQLGTGGTDAEINKALLGARKASKLKGMPTEESFRTPRALEPYIFACEWSVRHLQRQLLAEVDQLIALDEILCTPDYAKRFDELVCRVKPGFKPIDYRWAALGLRKKGKSKPGQTDLAVPLERQMSLDEALGGIPHGPGLYLIRARNQPLYVNQAEDLRDQLAYHREIAGDRLIPDWLLDTVGPVETLSYAPLTGIRPERLREVRITSIAQFRPWLNLLDLEGAA